MSYSECEVVKLTRVILQFLTKCFFWKSNFFPWFVYKFFFQFHHFAWNNLPLSFVIFSVFFLFGYYDGGLAKLTQISSGSFLKFFFCWTLFCLLGASFDFFFIPISYYGCEFIKLGRVDLGLLLRHSIFRFFFPSLTLDY